MQEQWGLGSVRKRRVLAAALVGSELREGQLQRRQALQVHWATVLEHPSQQLPQEQPPGGRSSSGGGLQADATAHGPLFAAQLLRHAELRLTG